MKKKEQEAVVEQPEQQKAASETIETPEKEAPTEQAGEAVVEQPEQQKADDPRIDAILKLNPQYEKVYIDSHGFVFTVGTPENQRNDAVLYENKYFKK